MRATPTDVRRAPPGARSLGHLQGQGLVPQTAFERRPLRSQDGSDQAKMHKSPGTSCIGSGDMAARAISNITAPSESHSIVYSI